MSNKKNPNKIKLPKSDIVYYVVIYTLMAIGMVLICYPLYFIVVASFSDPTYVNSGQLLFYPKGFTTVGYVQVFEEDSVWTGYYNTLIYTVCGTIFGLIVSLLAGYALSRKDLPYNGAIMAIFVFTMYFSGGLIPTYLVICDLNLINTRLLMIILNSVTVYNMILIRSFFVSSMAQEVQEAAKIDGCGNGRLFVSIVLPLSKPIIAVIALYIAVGHWNNYFNAMIYITSESKKPLQVVLRTLLNASSIASTDSSITDPVLLELLTTMSEVIKYCIIIVATVPILCMYPFIQKYFVKGVMAGAVKG